MKREKWSGFDKYVVVADQCKYLSGGYEGFTNLTEIMEILTLMCSKQQNTYTHEYLISYPLYFSCYITKRKQCFSNLDFDS